MQRENLIVVILISILLLIACEKDKNNDSNIPQNYIKINEEYYELDYAEYIPLYSSIGESSTYVTTINLLSKDISISDKEKYTGVGDIIGFDLYTNEVVFTTGQYNFDLSGSYQDKTFDGFFAIDFDFTNEIGDFVNLDGGSLTINKIDEEYEVIYSNANISCYYKGLISNANPAQHHL